MNKNWLILRFFLICIIFFMEKQVKYVLEYAK
jgi:hypothetical protein